MLHREIIIVCFEIQHKTCKCILCAERRIRECLTYWYILQAQGFKGQHMLFLKRNVCSWCAVLHDGVHFQVQSNTKM